MASSVLQISFKCTNNKITTLTLIEPKANLTTEIVNAVMDTIIEKDIFFPGGASFATKSGAKKVMTDKSPFLML